MTQVTLTEAAIRHLAADPKLNEWKKDGSGSIVPILGYYQRSYFKSNDGDITEFGDGFMLTFDRKDIDWADQGLTTATAPVTNDLSVLIVAPHPVFESDVIIDWNKKKYTYDPAIKEPASALYDHTDDG